MVLSEQQYKDLSKAMYLLKIYLVTDDASYPEGVKENYNLIHSKGEDILRDYENEREKILWGADL
jgi:hypothetical protein